MTAYWETIKHLKKEQIINRVWRKINHPRVNLSDRPLVAGFHENLHHGSYTDYATGDPVEFTADTNLELGRWGYRVFVR